MKKHAPAVNFEAFREEVESIRERMTIIGEDEFMALASSAIQTIDREPQRDEDISYLMADVWLRCRGNLTNPAAEEIGELFADLEVPDIHVQDAPKKWAQLRTLIHGQLPPSTGKPQKHVS